MIKLFTCNSEINDYIVALCSIIEKQMYRIYVEFIDDFNRFAAPEDQTVLRCYVLIKEEDYQKGNNSYNFLAPIIDYDNYVFDLDYLNNKLLLEEKDCLYDRKLAKENRKLSQIINLIKSNYALDSKPYLRDFIDKISNGQDYLSALNEIVVMYTNQVKKELK